MQFPKHVGIIMDGNGRWAQKQGKNRFWGHLKGSEVAQKIVEHCALKTSIKYLTLYAFSTENWSRPREEVDFLFQLLRRHLAQKGNLLLENNVKLKVIGDLNPLPAPLVNEIESLVEKSKDCSGLNLVLGLNYGGRQELVRAANSLIRNHNNVDISEEEFSQALFTKDLPDVDLVIRTSGEKRISNFLLWQIAYSEFYFSDTLWPDFSTQELDDALIEFNRRDRRFGTTHEENSSRVEANH